MFSLAHGICLVVKWSVGQTQDRVEMYYTPFNLYAKSTVGIAILIVRELLVIDRGSSTNMCLKHLDVDATCGAKWYQHVSGPLNILPYWALVEVLTTIRSYSLGTIGSIWPFEEFCLIFLLWCRCWGQLILYRYRRDFLINQDFQ